MPIMPAPQVTFIAFWVRELIVQSVDGPTSSTRGSTFKTWDHSASGVAFQVSINGGAADILIGEGHRGGGEEGTWSWELDDVFWLQGVAWSAGQVQTFHDYEEP